MNCSRILRFEYVPAKRLILRGGSRYTSLHKELQNEYLLKQLGWCNAILVREKPDGVLEVLDGDKRVKLAGDRLVPCLIIAVSDREARAIVAARHSGRVNLRKILNG